LKEAYAVRRTVPPSAEIEAQIDQLLAVGVSVRIREAVVAVARKLAALFWCLLTRGEDYAPQQPSLTAKKLRLVEIRAGAPTVCGKRTGTWATRRQMRQAERALAQQAEPSYTRMGSNRQAARPQKTKPAGPKEVGASVTPGRAPRPSKGNVARQTTSP
jgi:hypothetical protein